MGNTFIQQSHRFGQGLGEASQREGNGRSQAALEQPEALPRDSWAPLLPPERGSCGRAAGHGRGAVPLCIGTHSTFHKMGDPTTSRCCRCASFVTKWVGTNKAEHELLQHSYSTLWRGLCLLVSRWLCEMGLYMNLSFWTEQKRLPGIQTLQAPWWKPALAGACPRCPKPGCMPSKSLPSRWESWEDKI